MKKIEAIKNFVSNCRSSIFTKEDILKIIEEVGSDEYYSDTPEVKRAFFNALIGEIRTHLEDFPFSEYVDFDEDNIEIELEGSRELSASYHGDIEVTGFVNDFITSLADYLEVEYFDIIETDKKE